MNKKGRVRFSSKPESARFPFGLLFYHVRLPTESPIFILAACLFFSSINSLFMACTSIDQVITELDTIVETSIADNNFLGIFAYVYRDTTLRIREGIRSGAFEHNARMEKMDVEFANLYLEAYQDGRQNKMISASWQTAFDARHDNITLLQHLLLGMNAHINLDLGIAAAKVMEGNNIELLKNDFMKVNELLASLVDEMQRKFGRVSKFLFLLDWVGRRSDEKLINFSMATARTQSWNSARLIHSGPKEMRNTIIHKVDLAANQLALQIRHPKGRWLRFILRVVRRFEVKEVSLIIRKLRIP